VNGWHETYNDQPGPGVFCGHLRMIATPSAPADPPDACGECLREGTAWVELRRCLVCGVTTCCESSPRRHVFAHYQRTGHPVMAAQSGAQEWGWCYADGLALSPGD
jgi:monovalent cation/hydrogen antiporter